MASATKKKQKPVKKVPGKAARRGATKAAPNPAPREEPRDEDRFDDIVEPDRSAPALAEVDAEVLEFIEAVDRFKKQHGRPFPSWSEVLLILRQLGYRRG